MRPYSVDSVNGRTLLRETCSRRALQDIVPTPQTVELPFAKARRSRDLEGYRAFARGNGPFLSKAKWRHQLASRGVLCPCSRQGTRLICDFCVGEAELTKYLDIGGIRIEDTIQITSQGCKILNKINARNILPKKIRDIEKYMK